MAFQRKKPAAIGIKAPFPGFIEPELATAIEKVPGGERWLHEIKFDGYRVQVRLVNEAVKVFTRRGNDWTKRFSKVAADAYLINAGSAIIDGEVARGRRHDGFLRAAERTAGQVHPPRHDRDRKSTRLNSSHVKISYAVFCLKKKKKNNNTINFN